MYHCGMSMLCYGSIERCTTIIWIGDFKQEMIENINAQDVSAIFHTHARKVFGVMLGFLCEKANISQCELGRRSETYRRYLLNEGHILHSYSTGGLDQPTISRAIKGKVILTYSQVFIWLHLIREELESEEYKASGMGFYMSKELETDMWRLALYGTPEEVVYAYCKYEHMLEKDRDTEELPAVRRTVKLRQESTQ